MTQGKGKIAREWRSLQQNEAIGPVSRQDAIDFARFKRRTMYAPQLPRSKRGKAFRDAAYDFFNSNIGERVYEAGAAEEVYYGET